MIWPEVVERAEAAGRPTVTYLVFMVLAVVLAAIAVLTDSADPRRRGDGRRSGVRGRRGGRRRTRAGQVGPWQVAAPRLVASGFVFAIRRVSR